MAVQQSAANFIGRTAEIARLKKLLTSGNANLVVMKGRRRIGKSRLVAEFAKQDNFYLFSGLPPRPNITAQVQRDAFAKDLQTHFNLPGINATDWKDLFHWLARQTQRGKVIILLDEISWMAQGDPDFLGKLKTAWDNELSQNPKLMLILCGSVSSWIEKNIISSTGFLGRPSYYMTLSELPLTDCNQFWGKKADKVSAYEKLKYLTITGGVPRYLELMNPALSAEDNIRHLCFDPAGALFDEFNHIFADIYGRRTDVYIKIIDCLAKHLALPQKTISQETRIAHNKDLSEYLEDLRLGGFIARDYTWHIRNGKVSKLSHYRLKDNYTRFYMRTILPNRERIAKGYFANRSLSTLPGWQSLLGLHFESLVLNNQASLISLLGLLPEDIVFGNPFFQRKSSRHPGCQIDYMVQTVQQVLYVCEIKFHQKAIEPSVIDELDDKLSRLEYPKGFSIRTVLIHVNGVTDSLIDSQYFSHIIDFGELLNVQV